MYSSHICVPLSHYFFFARFSFALHFHWICVQFSSCQSHCQFCKYCVYWQGRKKRIIHAIERKTSENRMKHAMHTSRSLNDYYFQLRIECANALQQCYAVNSDKIKHHLCLHIISARAQRRQRRKKNHQEKEWSKRATTTVHNSNDRKRKKRQWQAIDASWYIYIYKKSTRHATHKTFFSSHSCSQPRVSQAVNFWATTSCTRSCICGTSVISILFLRWIET